MVFTRLLITFGIASRTPSITCRTKNIIVAVDLLRARIFSQQRDRVLCIAQRLQSDTELPFHMSRPWCEPTRAIEIKLLGLMILYESSTASVKGVRVKSKRGLCNEGCIPPAVCPLITTEKVQR